MKRLQRVRARIDDFVPAEKVAYAVAACDETQRMHDDIVAQAETVLGDDVFVRLDKSVETAERIFGF